MADFGVQGLGKRCQEASERDGWILIGHSREIDRDGDGTLTQAEVVGNAERMFNKMDRNSDGEISQGEMEASRGR